MEELSYFIRSKKLHSDFIMVKIKLRILIGFHWQRFLNISYIVLQERYF